LKIDHIQIDNLLNDSMPVFFCPTKELNKEEKNVPALTEEGELIKKDDPGYTPFIQIMITYSEIQD
jgi:hypothetical protein